MITRDVSQLFVVPALYHNARFNSCTVAGFTCYTDGATSAIGSSEFFPGFVIDRLALPYEYNSMAVVPTLYGNYGGSGDGTGFVTGALSAGIMHASASGGTFAAYSTGTWLVGASLWRQTTATSTANTAYSIVQKDVGYTSELGIGGLMGTATSTSAGQGMVGGTSSTGSLFYAGKPARFDLTGAKRFIKVVIRPQIESTGCGAGGFHMSAAAVFGEPGYANPSVAAAKRILVTTGCAT